MSRHQQSADGVSRIYDLLGVGIGPANLALMVALEEEGAELFGRELESLFLERKDGFCWHPGMLLDQARLQISFFKDLVTLRNPRSKYTFLNYVFEKGRLDEFTNLRSFFPTRMEFNDYYCWAAEQVAEMSRYHREVVSIEPVEGEGGIELVEVRARHVVSGEEEVHRARNLVVATGGVPAIPRDVDPESSPRLFHGVEFLSRIHEDYPDPNHPYHFVVVGSGQSAAEIFQYLYEHYPNAEVTATMRRFAYQPADDSHFVNEIFYSRMEDFFYDLPEAKRKPIIDAHLDTNFACVDLDLIEEIYDFLYQQKVAGETRAKITPFLELVGISDQGEKTVAHYRHILEEKPVEIVADGVILGTGYERPGRHPLLETLEKHLEVDGEGNYQVERCYRLKTREGFKPQLFLPGFFGDIFGISDTLLSTLPLRSGKILRALAERDGGVGAGVGDKETVAK